MQFVEMRPRLLAVARLLTLVIVIAVTSACSFAGGTANLLTNGDLSSGPNAPGWRFTVNRSRDVQYGVATDTEVGSYLSIKAAADSAAECWWSQEVPAQANVRYTLSFVARGYSTDDKADRVINVGVYFLAAGGKWMEYKSLSSMAEKQALWPGSTIPDTRTWKRYDAEFTAPPGCVSMGVRLNLSGCSAEAGFARLQLNAASSATDILNALPPSLPVFDAPLRPVTENGITQTPDWSLADATQWSSATRHKTCLNGLWAVQPVATDGIVSDAGPSGWAFVKVPGRLRGLPRSFFYGQGGTVWAKRSPLSPAFWLWREITLPAQGAHFAIDFAQLTGSVARAYWNGHPIGIVNDYWGARLDLPADTKNGDKGQLAVFLLCNSTFDSSTSHLIAAGKAARPYSFAPNKRPWTTEVGDVYLSSDLSKEAFDNVRISTSVRKHELTVTLDDAGAPADATWRLRVSAAGAKGANVFDQAVAPSMDGKHLRLTVPWSKPHYWTPSDPFLYSLQVVLADRSGRIVDESLPQKFGFREVWVDGKLLKLNGQTLRLRPRMSGPIFNSDPNSVRRAFALLRTVGFNCIIRSPAMQDEEDESAFYDEYYDIADEMGMMMVCYTPYGLVTGGQFGASQTVTDDLLTNYIDQRLIARTVNHPSVIAYSGFGPGLTVKGNPYNGNPDWFGVAPLDQQSKLDAFAAKYGLPNEVFEANGSAARTFVKSVKALAPDRPFLSHYDTGQSDGWGTFDYFNWTPVQEWESWIKPWADKGVKPIGAWEHGLPYPASFANHGVPDGDGEPWISEYAAAELGPDAYRHETAEYRKTIQNLYAKNKPAYGDYRGYDIANYDDVQAIWAAHNKRIYRSWRTYGVPMGIEPFGSAESYLKSDELMRGQKLTVASSNETLKTPGFKPDMWSNDWNWLNETSPGLQPFSEQRLTPLGKVFYENNRPLLVYIAGAAPDFATKEHVYWSGEKIAKQVAAVWDGFTARRLIVDVSTTLDGKSIGAKQYPLNLEAGGIKLLPYEFTAPAVSRRVSGVISLRAIDAGTHETVAEDTFGISVYPRDVAPQNRRNLRVGVVDPSGDSIAMLKRLGIAPVLLDPRKPLSASLDLVVIGRRALETIQGTSLIASLPPSAPVLVLEQTDAALAKIGLRAYPARARQAWKLAGTQAFPVGVENDDLRDWRVSPHLLPIGTDPLRLGYNFHAGYEGTVASVVIETPTSGNFTPLLQTEFDLAMTPLMETVWHGHRVVFCQLSLVDGVGVDPVATRIASELLTRLRPSASRFHDLSVIGDASVASLATTIGARSTASVSPADLKQGQIVLAGKIDASTATALKAWVQAGGTAVLLPQDAPAYAAIAPDVKFATVTSSLLPPDALADDGLLAGLGLNDFHARQDVAWNTFGNKGPFDEVADGHGRWILLGFDPRTLDLQAQPYLRLTYRRQCRAVAQILTNAGARLDAPVDAVFGAIDGAPYALDLAANGTRRITTHSPDPQWQTTAFEDKSWRPFSYGSAGASSAWLRLSFDIAPGFEKRSLTLDAGTFDDYDETFVNGVQVGGVTPENSTPDTAWRIRRIYSLPDRLLNEGRNVVAVHTWNRGAALGHPAIVRGPIIIRDSILPVSPYAGEYKHSDDPYLQRHW
ncbi:MAG: beta galactosidase jelly roll domain-containing protein [Capsulimonadaceae bacterium]|nr:beta galactosidase jelly roll domain-containing protein [Capsulimonadaceae bacterium]